MIYFLESGDTIKIGYSIDVQNRINGLKSGSSKKVTLLGVMDGDVKHEKILHTAFAQYRVHGEWFKKCPEILQFIAENRNPPDPDVPPEQLRHMAAFLLEALSEDLGAEASLRDLMPLYVEYCTRRGCERLETKDFLRAIVHLCQGAKIAMRSEGRDAFIVGMRIAA